MLYTIEKESINEIVILEDETKIPIREIYEIETGLFAELGYE